MLTATLKQIVTAAFHAIQRSRTLARWRRALAPSGLFIETRCARRIDALSRRVLAMRAKIAALSGHLLAQRMGRAVDADRSLRRMLGELKDDLNGIRRDLALWHAKECKGRTGARLARSIARLNHIAADTYAAATRLESEIEEHDRAFAH